MPFVKPFRKRRRSTNKAESLGAQIIGDRIARTKKKRKVGDEGTADDALDVTADGYVPADQSEKIFKYARELQDDEEKDAGDAEEDEDPADAGEGDDDDEEDVELEYSDTMSMKSQFTDLCSMPDIDGELDPEDERILNDMMPTSFVQTRNLADMILEKIREKAFGPLVPWPTASLPPPSPPLPHARSSAAFPAFMTVTFEPGCCTAL